MKKKLTCGACHKDLEIVYLCPDWHKYPDEKPVANAFVVVKMGTLEPLACWYDAEEDEFRLTHDEHSMAIAYDVDKWMYILCEKE